MAIPLTARAPEGPRVYIYIHVYYSVRQHTVCRNDQEKSRKNRIHSPQAPRRKSVEAKQECQFKDTVQLTKYMISQISWIAHWRRQRGGENSTNCHLLSPICVPVPVSELLDNEGSSGNENANSLHFAPTVAFAALYDRSAWYIHGQEGTRRLQYRMYRIGTRHYTHVLDVIGSVN